MTAEERVEKLSLDELAGQVLCFDIYGKEDPKEVEENVKKMRPGGIFLQGTTAEQIKLYTEMAEKYSSVPVIVAGEIEDGPGYSIKGAGDIPHLMALSAADDPELVEKLGREMGNVCRKHGFVWPFAPVVDLCFNFRSPESNVRTASDSPKQVVKITGALIRGLKHNHNMVPCAKHFPGEGVDERNSHFVTTINTLSKEEWMNTYGYVYKELIKAGLPSIMIGHVALPAYETEREPVTGCYLPAVFSKSIITGLLKEELGFDGCVVSDAMSMIGAAACVEDLGDIAIKFLNAGGDMVLFPEPTDHDRIVEAVKNGELSIERLKDAATRVIKLKEKANLFGDYKTEEPTDQREEMLKTAQLIADKSIKIVRNLEGVLPVRPHKGMKVLLLEMFEPYFHAKPTGKEFDALSDELEKYGCKVDRLYNPDHKKVKSVMDDYDFIVLCCKMSANDYHGGTMRIGWNNIMMLWRAYVLQHPKFAFVSFGEPFKLYDAPYLKTYVNAYSPADASQRAVAKVLLGQIEAKGKNPVSFKGFFEREVD